VNDLETYQNSHVIEHRPADFESPPESDSHATSSLIIGILRRWYIVLLIFLGMCAIGLPAIWLLIVPVYSVTGAIRVDPILEDIWTGESDPGGISYLSFMNTQAEMITSSRVLQRAADDLADKNLTIFEEYPVDLATKIKQKLKNNKTKPEPASILKQAIFDEILRAESDRRTEFIKVTMDSTKSSDAMQIVDAFINAYMEVEVATASEGEGKKLTVLENEEKILDEKLKSQREEINNLAQKFGSKSPTTFDKRQEIKLESIGMLLTEVTKWEARRIQLEAQVQVLKKQMESADATKDEQAEDDQKVAVDAVQTVDQNDPARRDYINTDPTLNTYIGNLALLEQELIIAREKYISGHWELDRKADIIKNMKEHIEQRRTELGKTYDNFMVTKIARDEEAKLLNADKELANVMAELELANVLEQRFRSMLDQEEIETVDVGRLQLDIEELQDEFNLTKERYAAARKRIEELKMERKRPARISIAFLANVAQIRDKRIKYSMALVFCAMASGMLVAFLIDKADLRLRTPEDVVKRIGIRIIGTTTGSDAIKRALLPKQIAGDYQTIRANLRLLNGDKEPKKLVITSPGMREGKTTFAINLATSMAKTGKKVLLIDGDLRKPDVGRMLNLPKGTRGLQDMLFGRKFEKAACSVPATGLDVLAADSRNRDDAYELLASPGTSRYIETISQKYDHVIIDTPPVLAFPDAMVWAKMADAVILTSFAGQTTAPDLREASEKLAQIKVKVLGTVLSNVGVAQSYYRYGYNYYAQSARSRRSSKQAAKLLLPVQGHEDDTNGLSS